MRLFRPFLCLLPGLALASSLLCNAAGAAVIRVKWDSSTNGPGNTWSNAYQTVTAAIAASASGDEVWVAGDSAHPYLEKLTLKEGVGLYGGFAGTETSRSQRNWQANSTVLNGMGSGDVVTPPSGAAATTVLDGFTVRNGSRGIYCSSSSPIVANNTISGNGRGIYCANSASPTITNNTVSGNNDYGIYCTSSSPTITNNTISGNGTVTLGIIYGTNVYCYLSSPAIANNTISESRDGIVCAHASPAITNNSISGNWDRGIGCSSSSSPAIANNTIAGSGNGIKCEGSSTPGIANNTISGNRYGISCYTSSSPIIANNIISGNGRGIYCYNSASPAIANNTMSKNGYGVYCERSSSPAITNNIVAFNAQGIYNAPDSGTPTLNNNCVYNPGGVNYDGLSAGAGDINSDPKLQSVQYGRLHIQPDSPCVNAGTDSAVQSGWKDMDGQTRIPGAHVDIGADESNGAVWPEYQPVVVRVSPSGVDDAAHDGSSWSLAKRTVQAGIDAASAAGGEVWVAAGSYFEHVILRPYAYVYGGFAGVETNRGQRDRKTNRSFLDGSNTGYVVSSKGGYQASALDGFTVWDGDNGIYCDSSSPAIANNTISGNINYGINCDSSSPAITNNIISGNNYGVYCRVSSSPAIANNTITGNNKAGIYCDSSSPAITNNTIYGNAPGISCSNSSSTITNNIVAFNSTGVSRSGSGTPTLNSNCVYNPGKTDYSGLSAGAGDINVAPLFVDRVNGDFHLQSASPCIDAGLDSAVPTWLLTDMDGQPRISGLHVDIGADEYVLELPAANIPEARGRTDGAQVSLSGVIVTAVWPDAFYVEQVDRACGIRVEKTAHGLSAGQSATIAGTMATNSDGERYIAASSASGISGQALAALKMTARSLGGAASSDYSASAGTGQQGIKAGLGINNIGLLVRLTGKVTYVDPNGQYFTVSDGSTWHSSELLQDSDGHEGVRIFAPGLSLPTVGQFVTVTGASSCYKVGSDLYPMVRVRDAADIVKP
ncbi:MAG: right-handed parallel beta-helix repeat-containing protein [Armatimonadetes bacterium]|nr:right-handed parallel beta-helix repeat-containing protein [Armatimonadota bacterium]